MFEEKILLVGCGILKREIYYLIEKHRWPLDTVFLDSSLHCDLGKLETCLKTVLGKHRERNIIVFYGTCHPQMDEMLAAENTFRTAGQNCAEILLGHALFTQELMNGAFFMIEDWVWRWKEIISKSFGTRKPEVIRNIFQEGGRKYLLCLRTPCSGDFTAMAEAAGKMVGCPLHWMDVSLSHLESVLQATIDRKIQGLRHV